MDTPNEVVVLGCNTGGLAVIRSLGRRGLKVIAMTHNRTDVGTVSKHVNELCWCPDPADEASFVEYLIENAPRWNQPLIIEAGDAFTRALSRNKAKLNSHYTIVSPDWEIASIFLEKRNTYALAHRNGVPCPWTYEPSAKEELDERRNEIPFPCIIKPILSHEFVKRFKTKVFVVESYPELSDRLRQCLDEGHSVLLQEIIPGSDSDFGRVQLLFDTEGHVAAEFYNEKIRQSPPQFGQMRVGRSVPVDAAVRELALRLFEGVSMRGTFCSVEFRRDTRDQQLKLMEVNIRAPRSSQLAISAGIDFPWLLYQDYIRGERVQIKDYRQTTWIEILSDVLNVLVKERRLLLHPFELIRPYFARHRVFAVFWLSDVKPFLKQFRNILAMSMKRS